MIEENGHVWDGGGDNRCHHCQLKHRQYLEFKVAHERGDNQGSIVCGEKKPADLSFLPKSGERPAACAVVQIDVWDENTGRWGMILDCKFNDSTLAHRIKAEIEKLLMEGVRV